MKPLLYVLLAIVLLLALAFLLGARERVRTAIGFRPADLGADPAAALAASEARFRDIRAGQAREIVWRDPAAPARTEWAVVYVHGFSASKAEIRPVPDRIAAALGANLFYTRLAGHGRTGAAMAEAEAGDWLDDVAEALEVGRRIGEKVIVIATSTGATAVTHHAVTGDHMAGVRALIFVSPNFGVRSKAAAALTLPWARRLLPLAFGRERDTGAENDEVERHWQTRYPTVALLPMAALVKHVAAEDHGRAGTPLLVFHSPDDKVVDPAATRRVFDRWGGPKRWIDVPGAAGPSHHVIAGDIMSPATTEEVVDAALDWLDATAGAR
ncbi:alpha/beta hydrolase [Minwuia thermotolerans]|uniref:Alpha/beta hydrolase n=1 Tax=Minwuia thermotolerans TaxID=2056226 RepID=A0A2M9G444_9PROT|nr:alpha/beta hydrolase [Minwuia thermotolerans]PJK29347.1 alpha/beta hydrolase [Minwuia thermotolerans]PJK30468.1 alpha/beta hydrolase [Minwuia thermotolerans]PJK30691.1 alpha/beta hydrolase [Minwuia thermotolerans]